MTSALPVELIGMNSTMCTYISCADRLLLALARAVQRRQPLRLDGARSLQGKTNFFGEARRRVRPSPASASKEEDKRFTTEDPTSKAPLALPFPARRRRSAESGTHTKRVNLRRSHHALRRLAQSLSHVCPRRRGTPPRAVPRKESPAPLATSSRGSHNNSKRLGRRRTRFVRGDDGDVPSVYPRQPRGVAVRERGRIVYATAPWRTRGKHARRGHNLAGTYRVLGRHEEALT